MRPYTTSMMLGGIRIPRVPDATMLPAARGLSYPRDNIGSRAIRVRMVTEAAMTPRQAARIVPNTIVTTASPPFSPPRES